MENRMTKDAFRSIQTGLHALGYTPGPIDGIDGPKTRKAALAFGSDAPAKPSAGVIRPSTKAMIYQGSAHYTVREIVVHCSATRPDWMEGRLIAEKEDGAVYCSTEHHNSWIGERKQFWRIEAFVRCTPPLEV
ncbi:peptidoglycan-binding domain-containing protein [Paracoccus benzoatiresistens]|uniref:Peptidoglycan-binding domain-containing protein n=1 Tax=Paracoccus benzoatiresistens TaxID=2997341 RepID=A0ABT4J9U0_9RHOB|nr:peptidoglycan-binding protein [Paracoccus sp. EF6]MCZ0963903.1 peptidoglycan-binding domain-containing protein [Paracoccus sp. EF6]